VSQEHVDSTGAAVGGTSGCGVVGEATDGEVAGKTVAVGSGGVVVPVGCSCPNFLVGCRYIGGATYTDGLVVGSIAGGGLVGMSEAGTAAVDPGTTGC